MDNNQTTLEEFFSPYSVTPYTKGEIVIASDVSPSEAYYLKSGYIRGYSISTDGIELTIHIFSPRTCFPMMSTLAGLENRYFYEALTDVEVIKAPRHEVAGFITSHPDVLLDFTNRLLRGLDKLCMRLEYLALQNSEKRIISALLYLANHFATAKENQAIFTHPFTHRDIASFAGVSRETASREWKKLTDSNLVRMEGRYIVICDTKQLTELGSM